LSQYTIPKDFQAGSLILQAEMIADVRFTATLWFPK
jgi:hypothetical protein